MIYYIKIADTEGCGLEETYQMEALLFSCLRAAVLGEPLSREQCALLTSDRQKSLYRFSKKHDLAHLVAFVLENAGVPMEEKGAEAFHRQYMTAVYRYEMLRFEQERICELFENEGIAFLPLKGAVLRAFYPKPWMRTSCDIDLLVKEEELCRAAALLTEKFDYRHAGQNEHDVQLYAPNSTHLELHFTLCVNQPKQDVLLRQVWKYAQKQNGSEAGYELPMEFIVFYILAHMAKHLLVGGCGIRPFLDLYLLQTKRCYEEKAVSDLCEKGGLTQFYHAVCSLLDVWFSGKKPSPEDLALQDFLLDAGAYGTLRNHVTVGSARNGKRKYLFSRLFPPKEGIFNLYPSAKKYPCLLPFYYIRRFGRLLLPERRKVSIKELRYSGAVTPENEKKTVELLEYLGL